MDMSKPRVSFVTKIRQSNLIVGLIIAMSFSVPLMAQSAANPACTSGLVTGAKTALPIITTIMGISFGPIGAAMFGGLTAGFSLVTWYFC